MGQRQCYLINILVFFVCLHGKTESNDDDDKKGHPFKPIYIFNVSKLV